MAANRDRGRIVPPARTAAREWFKVYASTPGPHGGDFAVMVGLEGMAYSQRSPQEALARAQLFACAPRMLNLLRQLVERAEQLGGWEARVWRDATRMVEALDGVGAAAGGPALVLLWAPDQGEALLVRGSKGWQLVSSSSKGPLGKLDAVAFLQGLGIPFEVDEVRVDPMELAGPDWHWTAVAEAWIERQEEVEA